MRSDVKLSLSLFISIILQRTKILRSKKNVIQLLYMGLADVRGIHYRIFYVCISEKR